MVLHGVKTYYSAINAAAEIVAGLGVSPAERTVVFCEDKLTLSMEKAIIEKIGGTFNVEVLTFGRYIRKNGSVKNALTKESAAIVVKKILGEKKKELTALSRLTSSPSFAFEMSELIAQLKSAKVTPEMIIEASGSNERSVKAKIHDIAVIFKAYEEFLKNRGLTDQSGILDSAPLLISRDEKLKKSKVIIAGYSSVTKQICEIIKTLKKTAASLDVIAVRGENDELYGNEFFNFVKNLPGVEIKDGDKTDDYSPEQLALLNGLFDHHRFAKAGLYSDKVNIFEAKSVSEEVDFIAKRITYLVTEKHYRFSDFCLAVGNLPTYSLKIKKTFDDYKIPYFSDEKRSVFTHPLAKLTLSLLKAAARGGDLDEIKKIIQNSLFISDKSVADSFISEITKNTVTSKLFLDKSFAISDDLTIIAKSEVITDYVLKIKRKDKASEYVKILEKFYKAAFVRENAEKIEEMLDEMNAEEESAFLTSALDKVIAIAQKTGEVLGDDEITLAEFSKLLEAGYKACEVRLIPQLLDCVYAAELKDCRFKRFRCLFAAGLNGEVPYVKSDTALLLDSDISELKELSVEIEPKISVVNKREKEAAGLAFSSFEEDLFLSYSLLSPEGKQGIRSDVIDYVQRIFCDKNGEPLKAFNSLSVLIGAEKETGERKDVLEAIGYMRLRPAFFSLVKDADNYKNGAISSLSAVSAFLGALKEYENGDKLPYAEMLLKKADGKIPTRKNVPVCNYFENDKVSASKLECYYSCPYKCFIKYGLGATDKITGDIRALDFGNALHNVAEIFVQRMSEAETAEEAEKLAEEIIEEVLSSPDITKFARRGDFAYSLKLVKKEGKKLCGNIYDEFKNSGFRSVGQEVWFDDWAEYKALPVRTAKNVYRLNGKADRVDKYKNYVRIIDYKTGKVDEKVKDGSFYTGRNIQLYLYMNAFVKSGEEPAGAYYYAVNDTFKNPESKTEKARVMAGKTLATDEIVNATDKRFVENGKSEVIDVKKSKKGKYGGETCDGVALRGYMKYAMKLAEQAVSDIESGVIVPSPYEKACDYCEYGGICGFDEEAGYKTRKVTGVTKDTIVEAAYADKNEEKRAEADGNHSETNNGETIETNGGTKEKRPETNEINGEGGEKYGK